MVSLNSLSSITSASYAYGRLASSLSSATLRKLKEAGIKAEGIKSEEEAKKLIKEKTEKNAESNESVQTDYRLEKIYERLKTLSVKLGISMSSSEKTESILSKIKSRIDILKDNGNPNINVALSEYDAIKYTYETLTGSSATLLTGLDILGKNNRALVSMRK